MQIMLLILVCLLSVACMSSAYAASKGDAAKASSLLANLQRKEKQVVVTYGTSLTENGAWVNQVAEDLNKRYPDLLQIVNSGGSGQYSKWGVDNFQKRVLDKNPDTLFLEFSINDSVARFNLSVEQAQKNLEWMIDAALKKNKKCEIILMTMTPGDKYTPEHTSYRKDIEKHYAMYRVVAKAHGLLLIDHYVNWKTLQTEDLKTFNHYVPDSIHPTPLGCQKVVTPFVLAALGVK